MKSSTTLTISGKALSVDNIGSYTHWANQIPMLSEDEEQALAKRFRDQGDLDAARKLVLAHLRFVIRIARGYDGYGLVTADLIQEGNIGLMKAVKRFDPSMGVRLVSFAIHWVRAEIHEFILRNWRIVKVATTKAQRKLFFNLRKLSKKIGWLSDAEVNSIATELNVSQSEVRKMETRLSGYDQSFDAHNDDDDNSSWYAPANYLEDQRHNPEQLLEHSEWSDNRGQQLHEAITLLDTRSQEIVKSRWLSNDKQTLHQLADKYHISAERVRQLEQSAMQKLRKIISTH